MTIALTPRTQSKLEAEARRRGVAADRLADEIIDAALPRVAAPPANQSSIDLLDQWEAQTATNDPAELRKRQEEFEQLKAELNATRLATDGASARVPFP